MNLSLLIAILFAHYIADFLFQSAWMANGKSKSIKPLAAHIGVYTSILILSIFVFNFFVPITDIYKSHYALLIWGFVNGALHFLTDFVSSRIASRLFQAGKIREFWATIGADQTLHYLGLLITANYILM